MALSVLRSYGILAISSYQPNHLLVNWSTKTEVFKSDLGLGAKMGNFQRLKKEEINSIPIHFVHLNYFIQSANPKNPLICTYD